jgi:hypothetical protein
MTDRERWIKFRQWLDFPDKVLRDCGMAHGAVIAKVDELDAPSALSPVPASSRPEHVQQVAKRLLDAAEGIEILTDTDPEVTNNPKLLTYGDELALLREAAQEIESLAATVATLRQERDEAQKNYEFMVDKAAQNGLEHYRQMGQETLAQMERAEAAEARVKELEASPSPPLAGEIAQMVERLEYVAHRCDVATTGTGDLEAVVAGELRSAIALLQRLSTERQELQTAMAQHHYDETHGTPAEVFRRVCAERNEACDKALQRLALPSAPEPFTPLEVADAADWCQRYAESFVPRRTPHDDPALVADLLERRDRHERFAAMLRRYATCCQPAETT